MIGGGGGLTDQWTIELFTFYREGSQTLKMAIFNSNFLELFICLKSWRNVSMEQLYSNRNLFHAVFSKFDTFKFRQLRGGERAK